MILDFGRIANRFIVFVHQLRIGRFNKRTIVRSAQLLKRLVHFRDV